MLLYLAALPLSRRLERDTALCEPGSGASANQI
jgi:hypothetical protein